MSTVLGRADRTLGPTEPATLLAAPHGLHRGKSAGWWGMVMVIFTEATFFVILLSSYWYIRFTHGPVWPPDGIKKPELMLVAGVMTPVLLLSSVPMHWAGLGIRKGRVWQLRLGLAATFLMGATFLSLQVVEYLANVKLFTPTTDAYGTFFYTITTFHGFHVAVGLLMNLWLQYYAWRGAFTAERYGPVENIVMYWHFVDAVWVFILTSLYLAPRFWP